jgi:hypothetical protein
MRSVFAFFTMPIPSSARIFSTSADTSEHLAELEPDVAATEHHEVRRKDLQLHDARRVEPVHIGEPGNARHGRAAAGVDHDPVGGEEAFAARIERDAHGARVDEAAFAEHEVDRRLAL